MITRTAAERPSCCCASMLRGRTVAGVIAVGIAVLCAGCGQRNAYVPPPPPEVVLGVAQQRPITEYHRYTGTTQASKTVEIRARVQGYLDRIAFQDGTNVAEGDLLFVIDQRPYRAQLEQAKAELEGRRASVDEAEAVYKRALELLPSGATARQDIDIQRGSWLVAKAAVLRAEAAVQQAQLNLDYTEIHAPISGRIGRRLVDVGNLVSSDTTLLTTIACYDPMYAYFNVSEANHLEYLKRTRAEAAEAKQNGSRATQPTTSTAADHHPVELGLADENDYPHQGYIDFADNTVNPDTGTILVRGVFANPPPYHLGPGLFARIRVPIGTLADALLVPEVALGTDQSGRFLLMVGDDNVVEHRAVEVGVREGELRVITSGLKAGERFVVEGLQKARPRSKVQPIEPKQSSSPSPQ